MTSATAANRPVADGHRARLGRGEGTTDFELGFAAHETLGSSREPDPRQMSEECRPIDGKPWGSVWFAIHVKSRWMMLVRLQPRNV